MWGKEKSCGFSKLQLHNLYNYIKETKNLNQPPIIHFVQENIKSIKF